MVNKRIIAAMAALLAASALFAANPPPGSTMSVTLEDGNEVTLQPDSTWNYSKAGVFASDSNDDIYLTLRDGRILWLKPDNTWAFTKTQPKSNRQRNYGWAEAFGSGTNTALDAALKTATDQVYDKLSAHLRKYIANPAPKNAQAYLMACIKDEIKENELDMVYAQTKAGWKADAKISILSHRVKKIIECWDLQVAPEPAADKK
ncbi:MAG: hypothetical protein LBH93_07415 [Chitinispirillales bacterium]|jgi:hypothetical protein|nr:hypothetical protein [Chitinispirillales bacterium]